MSSKLLGKVMAGAGLGAAALLICAPGTALADDAPHGHEHNKGYIYTEPKGVKPGHKFKIILKCEHPVQRPWVWSKITGKLWLKPVEEDGVRVPERQRPPADGGQPDDDGQPAPPNDGQPPVPPNGGQPPVDPNEEPPTGADTPPTDGGEPQPPSTDEQPDGQGGQAAYGYEAKYWAWAKVPHKTKPGHYAAKGSCGEGKILVLPRGPVDGGDGGASTDPSRTAAGASLLGAAALGGFLLIRRRRTDGSLA